MKAKVAFFVALMFFSSIVTCTKKTIINEWTISFEAIPKRVVPEESNINIVAYLLKQTHLSLFYESAPNKYESRILRSWNRASDNKTFTFCSNPQLKFDTSTSFAARNIVELLKRLHDDLGLEPQVHLQKDCVTVKYSIAMPNLLRTLTDLRYAPSVRCADKWDCGLGSFKVTQILDNKILLVRKSKDIKSNQFHSIVLAHPHLLVDRQITDINRSIGKRPTWIKLSNYEAYNLNLMQTIVLILNIPDLRVRKALSDCIDVEKFKFIFNPDLLPEQARFIPTILPVEVYSPESKLRSNCIAARVPKRPFHFVNWRSNNQGPLNKYLEQLGIASNTRLLSLNISPSKFVQQLLSRESMFRKFEIIPMALGAEVGNYSSFFRPLVAPGKKYVSYDIKDGARTYNELFNSTNKNESLKLARKLADMVNNSHMAVPLYQVKRTFYYPKSVRNLETGSNFLEYPEVAKLEVN